MRKDQAYYEAKKIGGVEFERARAAALAAGYIEIDGGFLQATIHTQDSDETETLAPAPAPAPMPEPEVNWSQPLDDDL